MNWILQPWFDKRGAVYLDDIIIYSKNIEDYVWLLEYILALLALHKLFVKRSKCKFGVLAIEFLSCNISSKSILPDLSKIGSIKLWPVPTSAYNVLVFLGITGLYSRFIPKYANKSAALTHFLRKVISGNRLQLPRIRLNSIKLMFSTAPIVLYPSFDLSFMYSTYASSVAFRASFPLDLGLGLLPLSYGSRKLNLVKQ